MTYSEPMEGIGLLKFSVRENGMLVIGWLMDLSGQPLGVQAESRVRPPETTEAAVDRVRDRIRQKVLARTAEPPKAGGHLYTDAWRELQRRYPDRADLMRRLNGEYWNESTLRAAVSYLIHQILPRLDQLGTIQPATISPSSTRSWWNRPATANTLWASASGPGIT